MQGYFSQMYQFLQSVIQYKDVISRIDIENTKSPCKEFRNIAFYVQTKHGAKITTFSFAGQKHELSNEEIKEEQKIRDAETTFYRGTFKWECNSWCDLVDTAASMYDDLVYLLQINDVRVPVYYNILGFNNHEDSSDDLLFREAKERADELDIIDFLKEKKSIDGEYLSVTDLLKRIENVRDSVRTLFGKQWDIDKVIKEKKRAYILSKLIENKIARQDYESYPELIEAYDAYVDVKNIMSGKTHKL